MVRINIIPTKYLSDQHLRAEWTEIQMLLKSTYLLLQRKTEDEICQHIPARYCLGNGHMLFFRNKLTYLFKRLDAVYNELSTRGFNVNRDLFTHYKALLQGFTTLWNDWQPTQEDYDVIIARIRSRILAPLRMKRDKFTYYRQYINPDEFVTQYSFIKAL